MRCVFIFSVVYWDTKLTNREVFRMSRAVAVDWDSLAGLMDISYPEQEAIRFNDVNYPDYWSRAQAVFALFNASEFFDRRLLQKYFGELGRNDLKKEMLDFAEYEVLMINHFLTVVAMEVLIKYCIYSFSEIDEFI